MKLSGLRYWTRFAMVFALGFPGASWGQAVEERDRATDALFSNQQPVPKLRIDVSSTDFELLREARSSRWESSRPEVAATVREGTNVYLRVALHLKGARGSFRSVDDKPALTLHFNEFVKGQRFHGLEKISLNNSVQDPTFLCEYIGRRLFSGAGVPVPRVTHATVALNGRPLGLYVLVEGWNQQFLRRHFSDTSGNFYEPPFRADLSDTFEVKSGASPKDHRALEALAAAVDETNDRRRWAALERTLDVDRFTVGMALEVLMNHWDSYSRGPNNYRLFHDRTTDRIIFFPHGMDQLFALRRPDADSPLAPTMRGRVAVGVMSTTEGRQRYFERFGWLLTNVYHVADLTKEVQTMSARLRPIVESDFDSLESFNSGVSRLMERIADRHETVLQQWLAATTPARFSGTKPLSLHDWNYIGRTGGPAFFRRVGPSYLQIGAEGPGSRGCWRTTLLLEPGRYRFQGLARIMETSRDSAESFQDISLRSSIGQVVERESGGDDNVRLRHEFALASRQYVDLVCQSDLRRGRAVFDPDSLTITRMDNQPTK